MVDTVLANSDGAARLRERGFAGPRVGFVLGSGWGHFIDSTDVLESCPYDEIPDFGRSTVEGHAGRLVRGKAGDHEYLAMQGRLHHYEGHSLVRIARTVALLHDLGVQELVVTCAAGGVNPAYRVGDLVLIHDFLNFMLRSPVRGSLASLRAPVRTSSRLLVLAEEAAANAGIPLRKGVLFSSKGPTYETPAEVRMARALGADVVSMSTAPELIAASSLRLPAIAFSCVTNMAPGVVPGREVNHEEVIEVMESRKERFSQLLHSVLYRFEEARAATAGPRD